MMLVDRADLGLIAVHREKCLKICEDVRSLSKYAQRYNHC